MQENKPIPISNIEVDKFSAFLMCPFSFDNTKYKIDHLAQWYIDETLPNKKKKWEHLPYELDKGTKYDEFVYFYPYIREILFNTKKESSNFYYLKWNMGGSDKFVLQINYCQNSGDKKKLDLNLSVNLSSVRLLLYELGVGILIFEVEDPDNSTTSSLADYLTFINLARRIYPPFIGSSTKQSNKLNEMCLDFASIASEIPKTVSIIDTKNGNNEAVVYENFEDNFKVKRAAENSSIYLSNIIRYFLDIDNGTNKFLYNSGDYLPIIDDRMSVHAYYNINSELNEKNALFINSLKEYLNDDIQAPANSKYGSANIWYQLIHIDPNYPSCQNDFMFKDVIKKSTYLRWANYGTFYGFSRFSSVIVSNFKKSDTPFIYNHHKTMYYQIAVLLLFYRGALLAFSKKSAEIAKLFQQPDKTLKDGLEILNLLYREFILFKNKYWFKEVTAQDQGIEIFNLWNQKLNNPELMNDIKSEIQELYEFVNYRTQQRENKRLSAFTFIGAIALPITLIFSFWGMGIIPESFKISYLISKNFMFCVIVPSFIVSSIFFGIFKFLNKEKIKR